MVASPNHELERLQELLSKQGDVDLAIAFGSVAAGTAGTDSDVDVAVLTSEPMSATRKESLIAAIAVATGRPVDLVDLRGAGVHLTGVVLRTGKRIVCREPRIWAELLARNLIDAADFLPYVERLMAERRERWTR
jgi:predicted nucleotidyltransferase